MGLLPRARSDGPSPAWSPGRFFEIPLERIEGHPTYWYRWQTPWINGYPGDYEMPLAPPLEEFEPLDFVRYRELSEVPAAHRAYLEQRKVTGRPALMFVHVPHVLVAGAIDTSGLGQIFWDEPQHV
jgi:hypothetical protein